MFHKLYNRDQTPAVKEECIILGRPNSPPFFRTFYQSESFPPRLPQIENFSVRPFYVDFAY